MDGILLLSVGAGVAAFVVTAMLMGPLVAWLRRRALLDMPNDRSSHAAPTPRGGGIAVTGVTLAGGAITLGLSGDLSVLTMAALGGALGLALLSWVDDIHNLPHRLRFVLQIAAVVPVLLLLPNHMLVAQGLLPLWLDRLLAGLAWLWFINLFNFMDGIDGLSGVQSTHLGASLTAIVLIGALSPLAPLGAIIAGSALGFLRWNWHPAKVFLGDVGSIPLGYLFGWLCLLAASAGYWAVALILPAYYWADASLTLLRRALKGERLTNAHREHFYQRAVHVRHMSHAMVSAYIAAGNLLLFGAAWVAIAVSPWIGLLLALLPVGGLLVIFAQTKPVHQSRGKKTKETPAP